MSVTSVKLAMVGCSELVNWRADAFSDFVWELIYFRDSRCLGAFNRTVTFLVSVDDEIYSGRHACFKNETSWKQGCLINDHTWLSCIPCVIFGGDKKSNLHFSIVFGLGHCCRSDVCVIYIER